MIYEPSKNDHGLPYNPFKSCVVPRPIAWISTISQGGVVNLAPFSQSNIVGWDPPYVMFSANTRWDGRRGDSVANAEAMGEFVFNMATYTLRDAVVLTSAIEESGVDEMAAAGLTAAPSMIVKPPRVKESPINLECKHQQTIVLPSDTPGMFNSIVVGKVVCIHIADEYIGSDGKIDIAAIQPLARMGYMDYTRVSEVFEMLPDGTSEDTIRGMSGGGVLAKAG